MFHQLVFVKSTSISWILTAAAAAKSLQSRPTLCDPIDRSPPGSPVPGILQARTLEWVAISFSNAWKWKLKMKSLSHVRLFMTPWTAAYQAPPSMGFSRQEYWSGVPLPSPWILTKLMKLQKTSFIGSIEKPLPCCTLLLCFLTFHSENKQKKKTQDKAEKNLRLSFFHVLDDKNIFANSVH